MNLVQAILNLNEYAIVVHNQLKAEEKLPVAMPGADMGLGRRLNLRMREIEMDDGGVMDDMQIGNVNMVRMHQVVPTNHDILEMKNNYNIENCLIKKLSSCNLSLDHLQLIKQYPTQNLVESLDQLETIINALANTDIDIDTVSEIKTDSKLRKDIIYHIFNDYKLFMNVHKSNSVKDNKDVLDKFDEITKQRNSKTEKLNVFETTQIEQDAKMNYVVSKEKLLDIIHTIRRKYTKIDTVAKSLQQIKTRMIGLMGEYMKNLNTYIKIIKLKYDIEKITQLISDINAKLQRKDEIVSTDKRLLKIYNNYNLSLLEVLHNIDINELKKKMVYSLYELIMFRNTVQEFYFFATFSTCKICLVMNTDTLLSCGHAFCNTCVSKNKTADDGTKHCYNCRQSINWYKNLYPDQNILI